MMPLKLINNKNLGFIVQKGIFEHCRQILTMKNHIIVIIFCHENLFLFTSSELAWIVLNKDVLFHCSMFRRVPAT